MHLANDSSSASWVRVCWAVSGCPRLPLGSRWLQALLAESNREGSLLLTLTTWRFGICPLLSGPGKLGTPWERMHWEKATSPFCAVVVVAVVEEVTLATLGEPLPQPTASSEDAATATTNVRMSG